MPNPPIPLRDEIGIAVNNLVDAAGGVATPVLRLGVTGLSRAGKTIFITALVEALLAGGRLPGFSALTEGRFIGARLMEPADPALPRFAFEQHLAALGGKPATWPESTRRISQLRLELKYQSRRALKRLNGRSRLYLDIVDYPGEWLLDLPLLTQSYAQWSAAAIARAKKSEQSPEAERFLNTISAVDGSLAADPMEAERLATLFTAYLRAVREDGHALSSLPPGRFLLPGDLEGSPALTFAPLPAIGGAIPRDSLHDVFARRFEAYKNVVVRPFFRDHFARLDRQIVLVDTIRALNAGPAAVRDLETALTEILGCFRQGASSALSRLWSRRIDRILFAATKADHIHSSSHDRLEAVMNRLVAGASKRARYAGAETRSLALAAVRATRESVVDGHEVILGTPSAGQRLGGVTTDGETEIALFPGDLPQNPEVLLTDGHKVQLNFLKFQPPARLHRQADGSVVLPHIRLDRAIEFLLGDRLA